MAEWRIGRGWSEAELAERLAWLKDAQRNFDSLDAEMTAGRGWNLYHSEATIAQEPPGAPLPTGPFHWTRVAVANYQFSDPRIVVGHFEAGSELLGRRILLEIKAVRMLHYLAGAVVSAVRSDEQDGCYTFGFRYDTLEGHIERGWEWFLLTKDLRTGAIRFRIEAVWLPGDFPNWWSRVGFHWLGPLYQWRWHHEAHRRLFQIARGGLTARPAIGGEGLAHGGPVVGFKRTRGRRSGEPTWQEEESIRST